MTKTPRRPTSPKAQNAILKTARAALGSTSGEISIKQAGLRALTAAEKAIKGLSAGAEHLVPVTIKKITKRTATVTRSKFRDLLAGISHTKATASRKAGDLAYKSAASEDQAAKASLTKQLKRRASRVEDLSRPSRTVKNQQLEYRATLRMRDAFWGLRERKLKGEFLDDGDWHEMVDVAKAINDPRLSELLRS